MEKEMEEMKTSYGWPILKMVLLLMFGPPIVYLSWKTSNAIRLSTKRLKEEVIKTHFNYNACINTFICIKYQKLCVYNPLILFSKGDGSKEREEKDRCITLRNASWSYCINA